MLTHLEPFLLAPSALTPTAQSRLAAELAATPVVWQDALRNLGAEPVRLRHNPLYEVWLVSPQGSGLPTPGASAVLAGGRATLQVYSPPRSARTSRAPVAV